MKRKLALLMAFMMAATLLPAQPVDAASKNSMTKTVSATSDTKFMDVTTAPAIILASDGSSIVGPEAGNYFELHLSGDAKWLYPETLGTHAGVENANVQKLTDSILGVTVIATDKVKVPLFVDLNGTPEGAQKITVVPKDSTVSSGEYTYANVGESKIKFRVQKKEKISRSGNTKVQLILDEMAANSFKSNEKITLKLPKDFSWGAKSGESGGTAVPGDNERTIVITPAVDDSKTQSYYVSYEIVPGRNAKYGDVDVTVEGSSDVSPDSLVVAEYVDYGVSVKAEKVLNVIAGKDIEGKYKAKLTIEEPAVSSLQGKRYMEFKFVDENGKEVDASLQHAQNLKLTKKSGDLKTKLEIDGSSIESNGGDQGKVTTYKVYTAAGKVNGVEYKDTKKANEFDLFVTEQSEKNRVKYELDVPFVVKSGFTGKLFLHVKGAGAEEQTVQIADVKAPVTFEVKGQLPQVKIGLQKQPGQDIAIKETEAGALQDYIPGGTSTYAEYNLELEEKFATFKSVKHAVEGDLSVKKVEDDGAKIVVQVDRKSTKPSTINLKDITVTLDRTVPYGEIKLKGNFGAVKARHDLSNNVKTFDYFTTVTPVSDDKRVTTVFTIGEKSFTEVIGGVKEEKTADVAPFIKDNRTMLPVRYVANAIGAIVNYDPTTRVATFQKEQTVVSINIDKDVMYANGSPIKLDTKPANVEGRIFLPIANVAQAFGLKHGETIIWNQENKTVTILPQDATKEEVEAAKAGKAAEGATMKEEKKEETKTEEKK